MVTSKAAVRALVPPASQPTPQSVCVTGSTVVAPSPILSAHDHPVAIAQVPSVAPESAVGLRLQLAVSVVVTVATSVDVQLSTVTTVSEGVPLYVPATSAQVAVAPTAAHEPGFTPKSVVGVSVHRAVSVVVAVAVAVDVQLSDTVAV